MLKGVLKRTVRQWVNKTNNDKANENIADIKAMKKKFAMLERKDEILKKHSPYSQQQNRRYL